MQCELGIKTLNMKRRFICTPETIEKSQAFSLRLLASEIRFHFQGSGVCGGQSGRGRVYPWSEKFFSFDYSSASALYSFIFYNGWPVDLLGTTVPQAESCQRGKESTKAASSENIGYQ